jgi:hypothetical protein
VGLVVLLGVCVSAMMAQSASHDKEPGLLPSVDRPEASSVRSIRLELHARKSLLDDKQLAGLNLGVRVREGVATLWGSVPTRELTDRAVKKVSGVLGILDVHSELLVVRPAPPPITPPLDNEGPTVTQSASPDREQGTLAPRIGAVPVIISAPEPSQVEPAPGQLHREEESPDRPAPVVREAEPVVKLLPPRVWTVSSADQGSAEEKNPPAVTPAVENLAAAIERIRTSDPRFRGLRVEVQGTALWVLGSAEQGGEAVELANQLSRIQGISGVVVRRDSSSGPR